MIFAKLDIGHVSLRRGVEENMHLCWCVCMSMCMSVFSCVRVCGSMYVVVFISVVSA